MGRSSGQSSDTTFATQDAAVDRLVRQRNAAKSVETVFLDTYFQSFRDINWFSLLRDVDWIPVTAQEHLECGVSRTGAVILIASPLLFQPVCKTPRHMPLASDTGSTPGWTYFDRSVK